ncbi:TIGR04283 family arsenosugar biosynthesis glycosyltransferase [Microcoleus sp. FACHB-1515]|uniref:TIGR04283 family arsenosugar biosynthesis glycosyltransferase n=1 Tax=Cyanophyceae TaxID=3028117 RepID=UPI001681F121|nr:TIGR04283 family arsenosugar biosynthesis glycosyltransferase [Microcoleus sp. FACHB-1515]MBD2090153.1 TIGR04283 family arsenosugar biosynthesis glycosyltransferase [Microcoleus sp. FACHB-1515]
MKTERLIIFTRYPEAGRAKTRLIPALGAEGAAQLQRQMTEWTIAQARRLAVRRNCAIEVHYASSSADESRMQAWLGEDLCYVPQAEGDLGVKLTGAIESAFSKANRVVVIGTDCPSITANLLDRAFAQLDSCDMAIGAAADGGYYLLGLRSFQPTLFQEIAWSTEIVFEQTIDRARQQQLSIGRLETLSDIDRPADLIVWEQIKRPKLAIVIPTLNEMASLLETLRMLNQQAEIEVIVSDGGSEDATLAVARGKKAIALSGDRGRARQMNAGARLATANWLLFLHADTRLPPNFFATVEQMARSNAIAGAFRLGIDGRETGLRIVEWGANWRSRFLQFPYGDQALFLRRDTFWQIGGFPDLPMMEDFELVRRLRRLGRIAIAPDAVLTSARRWQKLGVFKTTIINQVAIAAYLIGISPDRIARWYHRQR